jgi:hypothetical protein
VLFKQLVFFNYCNTSLLQNLNWLCSIEREKVALLQLQRVDDEGDEDGVEVDNWGICKKTGVCLSGIHNLCNVLDISKLFEDRV